MLVGCFSFNSTLPFYFSFLNQPSIFQVDGIGKCIFGTFGLRFVKADRTEGDTFCCLREGHAFVLPRHDQPQDSTVPCLIDSKVLNDPQVAKNLQRGRVVWRTLVPTFGLFGPLEPGKRDGIGRLSSDLGRVGT